MKRMKTMTMLVAAAILSVTAAAGGPKIGIGPELPDLMVQSAALTEDKLTATIRNAGSADALATQLQIILKNEDGSVEEGQFPIPALGLNASTQIELELGPGANTLKSVTFLADEPDVVVELNENNNSYVLY